jgi:hypothetical protein
MPSQPIHNIAIGNCVGRSASGIDYAIDTYGPLVLFLPVSSPGETWALTGGLAPHAKWLGCYLLEPDAADIAIRKMIAAGLRLRIDGHEVQS